MVFIDFLFTVPSHYGSGSAPHIRDDTALPLKIEDKERLLTGPQPKDKGIGKAARQAGQRESVRKVPGELNTNKDAHPPGGLSPLLTGLTQGQGGDGLPKG